MLNLRPLAEVVAVETAVCPHCHRRLDGLLGGYAGRPLKLPLHTPTIDLPADYCMGSGEPVASGTFRRQFVRAVPAQAR